MATKDTKNAATCSDDALPEPVSDALDTIRHTHLTPLTGTSASKTGGGLALCGVALGLLWFGGATSYLAGNTDLIDLTPAQLAGSSIFTIVPSLTFMIAGLLGREVCRAGARARRLDEALCRLAAPIERTEQDASHLADTITIQVDRMNEAVKNALARLTTMKEGITHHVDSLEDGSTRARDRVGQLVETLREERLRLNDISEGMDDKAAMIAASIQNHSEMVTAAAELADTKAAEGERLLRSGADRLQDAGQATQDAGDRIALSLDARATELREFSDMLHNRINGLETAYLKHRDRLQDLSETLRQEQEKIGAALDFHRAELETMIRTACEGADTLKTSAKNSGEMFMDAMDSALNQARELAENLSERSEEAVRAQECALDRLRSASETAREAAEKAGESFKRQAEDTEAALERISESGFDIARRADDAFQTRLQEAEDLTRQAEKTSSEISETVSRQMTETLETAQQHSRRIKDDLFTLRGKLEDTPNVARDAAKAMERVLENGLTQLNETARTASDQAHDIDALFQSRIRQNYELLSDTILRMGAAASDRKPPDLDVNELPGSVSNQRLENAPSTRSSHSESEVRDGNAKDRIKNDTRPLNNASDVSSSDSDEDPIRDSIRAGVEKARRKTGWRWRDLLTNIGPEDKSQTNESDVFGKRGDRSTD